MILDLDEAEVDRVLLGLNSSALGAKKLLRRRTDDGLNAARETFLVEQQTLADKIQHQRREQDV